MTLDRTTTHAPMPLAGRALLALALMVGFYLLALGLCALLLYIPYAELRYLHRVHPQIALSCLVGTWIILWAILPRFDRFAAPGPRLTSEASPQLFETIRDVAAATGQRMPAEVYLVTDMNAWVADRGGILGIGSRRVMGLGLPLLELLSVSQLRAVLAHEFGHYFAGDTRLGPWIYKTRCAIERTLHGLQDSALRKPFLAYGRLFLRITHAVSRRQELAADRLAAVKIGAGPLIEGLRTLHGAAPAFASYWRGEVVPLLSAGFRPPLAEGFSRFISAAPVSRSVNEVVERELAQGAADPYDTHPPLSERIAAIGMLGDVCAQRDDRRAACLLGDVDGLELSLLASLSDEATKLRRLGWDEVAAAAWLPMWEGQVRQHVAALEGLTPLALPKIAAAPARFAERVEIDKDAGVSPDDKQQFALFLVGAAFAVALGRQGWRAEVQPGEPVRMERERFSIRPFETVAELMSGATSAEDWAALCEDAGVVELRFGEVDAGGAD